MPPKGGNAKKEGGRAKKAENEAGLTSSLYPVTSELITTRWDRRRKLRMR